MYQLTGKGDGEILDTNWSMLNGISSMTRTMTLAHRSEVMDAHIGDNNWKKMINMGRLTRFSVHIIAILRTSSCLAMSLCARWKRIFLTKAENVEDFELMDEHASTYNQREWEHLVEHADLTRLDDVSVMDIYNVKLPNGTPFWILCQGLPIVFSDSPAGGTGRTHGGGAFIWHWNRHYELADKGA